ncbi:hypothetical protein EDB84DRAFT_1442644 [Lactarius hengduanensis]|nr:hypothetical protein EDB84DRAFT_1442644 [Lactarius hengduanensis]
MARRQREDNDPDQEPSSHPPKASRVSGSPQCRYLLSVLPRGVPASVFFLPHPAVAGLEGRACVWYSGGIIVKRSSVASYGAVHTLGGGWTSTGWRGKKLVELESKREAPMRGWARESGYLTARSR